MTDKQLRKFVNSLEDSERRQFMTYLLATMPISEIKEAAKDTAKMEVKNVAQGMINDFIDDFKL